MNDTFLGLKLQIIKFHDNNILDYYKWQAAFAKVKYGYKVARNKYALVAVGIGYMLIMIEGISFSAPDAFSLCLLSSCIVFFANSLSREMAVNKYEMNCTFDHYTRKVEHSELSMEIYNKHTMSQEDVESLVQQIRKYDDKDLADHITKEKNEFQRSMIGTFLLATGLQIIIFSISLAAHLYGFMPNGNLYIHGAISLVLICVDFAAFKTYFKKLASMKTFIILF